MTERQAKLALAKVYHFLKIKKLDDGEVIIYKHGRFPTIRIIIESAKTYQSAIEKIRKYYKMDEM